MSFVGPFVFPAGVAAPVGYEVFDAELQPPPALLCDAADPLTGEITSLTKAPHPVDAAVAHLARARFGSGPGLGDQGHKLHTIRKLNDTYPAETENELRRTYKTLVDGGHIRLEQVRAEEATTDMGAALVRYRNTRTSQVTTQVVR
jgi:hypothetical protein